MRRATCRSPCKLRQNPKKNWNGIDDFGGVHYQLSVVFRNNQARFGLGKSGDEDVAVEDERQ